MSRCVLAALVLCAFAGRAAAQGLGDAARQEGEKRSRSKASTAARTYTAEDLEQGGAAPVIPAPAPTPEAIAPIVSGGAPAQGQVLPDRPSEEKRWRHRASVARSSVATLEKRFDEADRAATWSATDGPMSCTGRVNTRHGRDMEQLQEARQQLAAARQALEDFEEEARRAGVPPGWLR